MVKLKPFNGWVFDEKKVGDLSLVVAPPHDVISEEQRKALEKKSKYNTVRVILPEGGDHSLAAKALSEMVAKEIIIRDSEPHYYLYEQEFSAGGKTHKRAGFLALVKAEPFGKSVLPHERTFPNNVDDRVRHFEKSRSHFAPVFSLYGDEGGEVKAILRAAKKKTPMFEFVDDAKIVNRVWRISETGRITKLFSNKKVIIADGHHRYTAALKLSEMEKTEQAAYVLMYLADMGDPALKILPTHRIVRSHRFDVQRFLRKASEFFDITEAKGLPGIEKGIDSSGKHTFGLYTKGKSYLLKLKDASTIQSLLKGANSRDWRELDVSVLDGIIIEKLVGIPKDDTILFAKSAADVKSSIASGLCDAAFLLAGTSMKEVEKIVKNGEVMPHKSTYFYPKPLSGVVIYIMGS